MTTVPKFIPQIILLLVAVMHSKVYFVCEDLDNSEEAVKRGNAILPYANLEFHILNVPHYGNYSSPKPNTPIPPLLHHASLSSQSLDAFYKNFSCEKLLGSSLFKSNFPKLFFSDLIFQYH